MLWGSLDHVDRPSWQLLSRSQPISQQQPPDMWMKRPWRCLCLQPPFEDWSSAGKEFICNAGDPGLIPGSGRSTGEGIGYSFQYSWASLVAQLVKNRPTMQETWVQPLGWEDPLERERLPIPVLWPGEFLGLYSPWGHRESFMTERFSLSNPSSELWEMMMIVVVWYH